MDHSRTPVLAALQAYRDLGFTSFNPAGQGVNPRVLDIVGADAFAADAEHAFFSTCGSTLSVKSAMPAGRVRDGHQKSVRVVAR